MFNLLLFHVRYNGSQEWVVISDNRICCYSRREFNRGTSRNVKAILPLCNPSIITVLHATLKRNTTTPSFNSKEAFAIEQLGHNNDIMTYFEVDPTSNKKDWIGVLENVLQEISVKKSKKYLKEVRMTPMLL